MSPILDLDKVPIHIPELGPFTSFHPALTFTESWTATDEQLLQEDYLNKDFPIPKDRFPYPVCYSWKHPENEASHPESDYVWRLAYKFFQRSPYDLFPRMKTGSNLDLSDKGVCKLVAQVLCVPGVQGNVEFLYHILQYAAHFVCIRCPKPKKYSGKSQPEHLHFMEALSKEKITEKSTIMKNNTHTTPKQTPKLTVTLHHRSDPDPSLTENNVIPNLEIFTLITTAWNLYAKSRNLLPLSTYDFNIRLQFSAIQADERVSVASFKRDWKVQWPLEFRRNVVRKHLCGYAYLYRDTHARELVEFIERVVPEGWNLRDGDGDADEENSFYSVRNIVQGIERCGGGESMRGVERHVASIRGREWHCFSGDGGWREGGERLLFFPLFMKRWWTQGEFSVLWLKERRREREKEREKERPEKKGPKKERELWIERVSGLYEKKEREQEKQVWTAGPNEVYLDHNGEYVDTESGESWFITKEKSEALSGCRNCCRPVCCQVRRRWNGVFVRIVV
ncbi:hypothetical protein BOTCAL_1092g00010 [Botryotinia calthae]|uniref:Uncharacterized protein n=1 Tax=Botryotinia calthae TaxID=38488 RepID=A0A4Y8CDQ0_9HELO|nr:hypothetical protein BOTCAL_1092g00010 [Botryotinia calthae]